LNFTVANMTVSITVALKTKINLQHIKHFMYLSELMMAYTSFD
jgi:hypothetical protein